MMRSKKWLMGAGIAVVTIPLVFWALVILILPGVIRDQASTFGEKAGYRVEIGEIDLSPLLLRARLNDLRLSPQDGQGRSSDALLKLRQLEIDARFWPLLAGRLSFERIALDEPELLLARPDGKKADWNWQVFADQVTKLSGEKPPKNPDEHSSLQIRIDDFVLNGGRIAIRDGVKKSAYDFGPLSLHLSEVTNQDDAGHVGGTSLQSRYMLNLGRVQIPLPRIDGVPDRKLVFDKVTASGRLVENSASALQVEADLTLDDGVVKSSWSLSGGALSAKIAVESLRVKPLLSLAPSYQPLESPSGVINAQVVLKQDADALTADGDLNIDNLDIRVSGEQDPVLAWTKTSLNRFQLVLPRSEATPGLLTMNEVLVDNPKIRFVINAQRISNFRALFSKPEAPTKPGVAADGASETVSGAPKTSPAAAASPPSATATASAPVVASHPDQPGFRYDIRSVRLKNGFMFFADESIKPVFRVDVNDLNGSVQGISNASGRYATLVLNGRAAKTGSLRARGQLAFSDPRQNNDVSLIFRNIPLNTTNPYAMTFAGYPIEDGRIDVDLRYVTKDGQLQGKNRFVIKKIRLGEPVPDYQGTRLPLGLAIALLEDSDGMIDVNIPVKGNVNEPEFSVGHLVWQAVKTVLTNVVTAPFRALGALLGIENLDAIGFVPGESALPLEDEEQLTKIAELLAKRPKSKLVIHGTYDPSIDAVELARAMADKAILEASGIKVVAGEPLPLPNLTDPKVRSGLKSAYGSQVGRIKLGQRLLTLPDNAERDNQLRQELIASYKISDEQLKQLAAQRAEAVKAKLLSVDKGLADRITIGDPETVSADESRIPLRVQIEAGS